MSHLHEREEKICLNCSAQLTGRYCADCGQENVEPKETVWHLFVHFFNDITHFDGKFFATMKLLLLKPGFLTNEYVQGRRASYLNPIRMYLFISAVFFLIMMSTFGMNDDKPLKEDTHNTRVLLDSLDDSLNETLNEADTLHEKQADKDTIAELGHNLKITRDKGKKRKWFNGIETVHEYDSLQERLPKKEKDNFIVRYYSRKYLAGAEVANDKKDPGEFLRRLKGNAFHALPKVFFISLPLFALLLMLLYVRRRKDFYYVSHAIFTVHIYCFSFIMWTLVIVTHNVPYLGSILTTLVPLIIFFYLYKAMRKFYKQGRAITLLKFIFMYFGISILVILLVCAWALNAFMNVAAPH